MSPLLFGGKQSFTINYSSSPKTQKIPGKFHWWMATGKAAAYTYGNKLTRLRFEAEFMLSGFYILSVRMQGNN